MLEIIVYLVSFISLFLAIFWISILFLEEKNMHAVQELRHYPFVSIIVPAWNEADTIARTLETLLALKYRKDRCEIIVVANNCEDDTADIARKIAKESKTTKIKVLEVRWDKNLYVNNKAHAQNLGLEKAKGELIAITDADSIIDPDSLLQMVPNFDEPKVGAVVSSLKVFEPKNLLEKLQWFEYLSVTLIRRLMASVGALYVSPGAFNLYRKELLDRLGRFDESNITEDTEIAFRFLHEGYGVRSQLDVITRVHVPESFGSFHTQRVRWTRGFFQTILKYRDMLFNRRYGLLGMFLLPSSFIIPFILIVVILAAVWNIFLGLRDWVVYLSAVGFDLGVGEETSRLLFGPNTQYALLLFSVVMGIFGVYLIFKAQKHLREGWRYPIAAVLYLTVYQMMLSAYWLVAIAYELAGTKKKWRSTKY